MYKPHRMNTLINHLISFLVKEQMPALIPVKVVTRVLPNHHR
jgi:hypothetical protein